LDKTLERLPSDLFGIYDRFMLAIPKEHFCYVEAALRWIMFNTGYPFLNTELNLTRLGDAVAFDFSNAVQYIYKPNRRASMSSAIPKWLAGLIELNHQSEVTLAHASVQAYLLSDHFKKSFHTDFSEKPSHSFISRSSISYLLYLGNNDLVAQDGSVDQDKYPLFNYTVENWYEHLSHSDGQETLLGLAMQLLQDGSQQYLALSHFHQEFEAPLYFCCKCGYLECVSQLIQKGCDINVVSEGGSPLSVASYWNRTSVIHLLLKNGANVNSPDKYYGSALGAASYCGRTQTVELLLDKGANINLVGGEYGSALGAASYYGRAEVVKLLLDKGANINLVGGEYGNALGAACYGNQLDIVEFLLEKGADINLAGGTYGNPLGTACSRSSTQIAQHLLDKGANINLVGGKYGSALSTASYWGRAKLVELLLNQGANIRLLSREYGNALGAACYGNEPDIVLFLLRKGANINLAGGKYRSALAAASASKYNSPPTDLVRFLLENGADIKSHGGRALREAIKNGYEDVVALLREHGALLDEEVPDSKSKLCVIV
jgi:ankyrin repeat protein